MARIPHRSKPAVPSSPATRRDVLEVQPNLTVNEFIDAVVAQFSSESDCFLARKCLLARKRWLEMIAETQPTRERKIQEMTTSLKEIGITIVAPGITSDS
jgi:hypothetical protein